MSQPEAVPPVEDAQHEKEHYFHINYQELCYTSVTVPKLTVPRTVDVQYLFIPSSIMLSYIYC